MTYSYMGNLSEWEPPANSDVSNTSDWSIRNDEFYSRDVSSREVAIFKNNSILEYPFYGLDMIVKLKNDELHFYQKDHLGSVRAIVNDNSEIVAEYDYNSWGYPLEVREYNEDSLKFKYMGKEFNSTDYLKLKNKYSDYFLLS